MDTLRRWRNWIRIKWLEAFTDRVDRFKVPDGKGGEQEVVVERSVEKVCDHKEIREIAPTMWACATEGCDTYFQIGYKVMLTKEDLVGYLKQLADHLEAGKK